MPSRAASPGMSALGRERPSVRLDEQSVIGSVDIEIVSAAPDLQGQQTARAIGESDLARAFGELGVATPGANLDARCSHHAIPQPSSPSVFDAPPGNCSFTTYPRGSPVNVTPMLNPSNSLRISSSMLPWRHHSRAVSF